MLDERPLEVSATSLKAAEVIKEVHHTMLEYTTGHYYTNIYNKTIKAMQTIFAIT